MNPQNQLSGDDTNEPKVQPLMFTIAQACEMIATHYEREFKHLKFIPPMQIIDGCSVEFIDDNVKVVVATARIRFRNRVHINKTTGEMHMELLLSDISFNRSYVDLSVGFLTPRK